MQDVYTFAGTDQCQLPAYELEYVLSLYTNFQITTINLLNETYYCQVMSS